jgi:hypothetical protein
MLTLSTDNGVSISVDFDRYVIDRWQYRYTVRAGDDLIVSGDDLKSGRTSADHPADLPSMARSLLSFLAAGAEYGRPGSHDADDAPFTDAVCEQLYMISDELDMLSMDLGDDE